MACIALYMPDPDERARFLTALYDQARQDGEDPEAVAERIYDNLRGVSRRELLQAGGALSVGGLLGGGSGYALTQEAEAQAATDDSDGNVGTPNDRVDVFADGVDSNVVSAADRLDIQGRTDDPTLAEGRFWTRSDEDVVKVSPDGVQELRIGWSV